MIITVMADHRREPSALWVAQQVGAETITWDTHQSEWDTGRRALAKGIGHDWLCVLQDDAAPIPDLRSHLEAATRFAPRTCISLYTGTTRPLADRVTNATVRADRKATSWLTHSDLLWGVGILIPGGDIPALLRYAEYSKLPYDRRIGDWYHTQHRPVYYCWPSLVNHMDFPSLVNPTRHDRRTPRRAHRVGIPDWNTQTTPI